MKHPSAVLAAGSTALLLGAIILFPSAFAENRARENEVAQRGAAVMPFSLRATTHIFTKTADGGIQQVVAKHPDPKQVALIRGHLAMIAQQFSAGNFEGPEAIHGDDMPGLAVLRGATPGALKIEYRDLPEGGEIVYHSNDARLAAALHEWFDAQLSDHGHDAMAGHDPGMMHHHSAEASTAE